METLPPKTEHRIVRTRSYRLGPDGIVMLLRDLRRGHFTGKATVNLSQGGLGLVVVEDSQEISPESPEAP